jgi:deoxyribonuclease (pyrimidine dimer)
MTRINIIPPNELYDQHLIAEYREITMIPAALSRTLNSLHGLRKEKISKTFTLNRGHVYFFYDKGLYLDKRYNELIAVMKSRGFNPDSNRVFPKQIFIDNGLYNDWTPTPEEQELIRVRIRERVSSKPHWYRMTDDKYCEIILI